MIKEVNHACKKLNNTLGIFVICPNPKRRALIAASVCNFIVGAGLVAAGVVFPSKSCVMLGCIGVISSAVLRRESRNNSHES